MGPAEFAECFPVPGDRFRVVGQVSGAVIRGGRSRKSRRARPARAVTRPTGAHISGRSSARQAGGSRTTVRSNRSEPMTSGNAPAAIVTTQLTGIEAGQWTYRTILSTVPPCAT